MKPVNYEIFELLKRISDTMEKCANSDLQSKDITSSQLKILFTLFDTPDGCMQLKELEHRFGVAQSTAAGIVQRLEKKEFVKSISDKDDKRIKIVGITDSGRNVCMVAIKAMNKNHERILNGFSEDEKKLLEALLRKIVGNFEKTA